MNPEEYKYLEDTLMGRRGRDKGFEAKMTGVETGRGLRISNQAEERRQQLAAKTPTQRELEQREFSLKVYGRTHMERYARPIVTGPYGELSVPGDSQMKGHSAEQRPIPPKHLKLQFHSGESGCQMWKV
jgi:hypothetical protein